VTDAQAAVVERLPRIARGPRVEPDRLAQLEGNAQRAAKLLKAMANPARLVVLCQLADGERSVGELERAVGMSQSGISQHLALLRRAGVVSSRRVRQTMLYSLASEEVVAVMATLYSLFCESGAPLRGKARRAQVARIDSQSS
jgi:ArsR family transcriptional regulator, virulence genes transcriptional regulator